METQKMIVTTPASDIRVSVGRAIIDRTDVVISVINDELESRDIQFRVRNPDIGADRLISFVSGVITGAHLLSEEEDELIQVFIPNPPATATAIVRTLSEHD